MQVGQGLGIIQPATFGHKAFEKLQDPIGSIDEAVQDLPCSVRPCPASAPFVEESFRPTGLRQMAADKRNVRK